MLQFLPLTINFQTCFLNIWVFSSLTLCPHFILGSKLARNVYWKNWKKTKQHVTMTHQSFLRCKILEMCHLYSGLDCAKSLVFSITATLDWSRITWPPRASWLRQGALKFIVVASRFVYGSDRRDRSKFNFEEKKDGIKFGVTERF